LDELDAEAIGTSPDINWLRDYVVYPQPGHIAILGNSSSFVAGWVLPISSFSDFPEAISKKFEIISTPAEVSCTCEDILKALSDIDGRLWSWENSVKNYTMAIWTLKNNVHNWANLTVALDDIKSEIEEILYRLGETPEGSTGTIWGDINRIWSLTNNVHNWANLTVALDDIKSEIEGISTVSSGMTIKTSSTGSVSVPEGNKSITITCDRAYQVKAVYINMTNDAKIVIHDDTLSATISGIDYKIENHAYSPEENEKFEYFSKTWIGVYPALPANGVLKIPIDVKKSGSISVLVIVETTQDATLSVTIS
jgi:hypothetical protein